MSYATSTGLKFGFSTHQQTSYSTALTAAECSHETDNDNTVEIIPNKINNAGTFGKGHGYATWRKTISLSTKFSPSFRLTAWMVGYTFSFAFAKVTTNQLEVGPPAVYEHIFEILPVTSLTGLQLPVTTIWQEIKPGEQMAFRDMLLQGFSLSGKTEEHITTSHNWIGSGHFEDSSIVIPDLVQSSFLLFNDVKFEYNSQDISAELQDWTYNYNNSVNEKTGYHPGCPRVTYDGNESFVRGRLLKNSESMDMKFKMLRKDDSLRTDMLKNIERTITFTATGDPIDTTYDHKLTIEAPKAVLDATNLGKDDKYFVYDCSVGFNWDNTLEGPLKATLITDVADFLALPV
jgi:hypothetical protein